MEKVTSARIQEKWNGESCKAGGNSEALALSITFIILRPSSPFRLAFLVDLTGGKGQELGLRRGRQQLRFAQLCWSLSLTAMSQSQSSEAGGRPQ